MEGSSRFLLPIVALGMRRHTKIIATLGPAVASLEAVSALVAAGMDVARLNFSHGAPGTHRRFAEWVRAASAEHRREVALLQDIRGPKIRLGAFPGGSRNLETGATVRLVPGDTEAREGEVAIDYAPLLEEVGEGDQVNLADGRVRLVITATGEGHLVAEVVESGEVTDRAGVSLPASALSVPVVTNKDLEDLEFGRELEVDYVAASFVRNGEDLRRVSEHAGEGVPVIAKIELAAAYANLDEILTEAAGIMVARGDLGVELPLERIPLVQQDILTRTNAAGLVSITATEMLESMVHASRPTRAEVTDVATAVLAETDAVMLSAETAIGDHPVRAVQAMARICLAAEERVDWSHHAHPALFEREPSFASALADAAVETAHHLGLATIVAFTETGNTARLVSKYRPAANIVAFSPNDRTRHRMALYWAVDARPFGRLADTDAMIASAEAYLLENGLCSSGDDVVMLAGIPPNQQASTNLLKLHRIGAVAKGA